MTYNFQPLKEKLKGVEAWLKKEYAGIRTGRATPSILDGITIEAYGTRMPLSQVGSISIEDARSLLVSPWEAGQIKDVEKAIITANLGLSASATERGVRVVFPELTAERRESLSRLIKERLEHTRVTMRVERDKVWHDIQAKEKAGDISEDEKFRYKNEMEKIIDACNKGLEGILKKKEVEIKG